MTRAYHGEQIREKQWQRMFRSRMQAVVPMDHRYLAEHDGSELASGRGSGREKQPKREGWEDDEDRKEPIPYMNMVYAPIERRLDMAVWRALFASSARQARQFVIHGNVKVNGQKVCHPICATQSYAKSQLDAIPRISLESRRSVPSRHRSCHVCNRRSKIIRAEKGWQEATKSIAATKPKNKAASIDAKGNEGLG